jgi:hypothetical protein
LADGKTLLVHGGWDPTQDHDLEPTYFKVKGWPLAKKNGWLHLLCLRWVDR